MLVQYFLIFFILLILLRVILRFREGILRLWDFLFWLVFWLAAGLVVLIPETVSFLAERLGIGRGADMVVYFSLIIIFYILFRMMLRQEKIEREITKVVRKISLSGDSKDK